MPFFFNPRIFFNVKMDRIVMKRIPHIKVPILVGIVPLKSAGMARFMNSNVAGITIPEPLIKRMRAAKRADRMKVSAEIAGQLIRDMKDMCQGAHLMPLGWTRMVKDVLEIAGL